MSYDAATKERALAMCANPKMNPGKVAKALGLPRATVYDWYKSAQEGDPDFIAMRRNKIRSMMDKAYAVAGRSIDGLDKQSKVLKLEKQEIDKILLKILSDDELDDKTREKMVQIVQHYTGTTMMDMLKIAKESFDISDKLQGYLSGDAEDNTVIQISFADSGLEEMME